MHDLHPWVGPIAGASAIVGLALVVGLVLSAFGVAVGGWLALISTLVLLGVLGPLYWLAVLSRRPRRSDPPKP
jgi:hypothetical protein